MMRTGRGDQSVRRSKGALVPVLAITAPIVVAYGLLEHFLCSYPWQDDYSAILGFGLDYERMPTLGSRLAFIVASQHVAYKLIFEHCLLALQLALLGHVNFEFLVVAGNLFLLGTAVAVWKMCLPGEKNLHTRLLAFVPVSFLFFSLNYSETTDWAMAGLQNLPVIFFSLLTLYLLFSKAEWSNGRVYGDLSCARFWVACASAALASLSSANGFLVLPIGLWLLCFRREVARCAVWCLLFLLLIAAYVYRYQVIFPGMRVPLYTKPLFLLAVLGDAAPPQLIVPFGLLILCIWIGSFRRGYFQVNPYAVAVSVWIFGTAWMIAEGRGNFGLRAAYASRYKIYSDLFLIFCYDFGASWIRQSALSRSRRVQIYQAAVLTSLLYCIRGDVAAWRLLSQRRSDVDRGMAAWRQNPSANSPMFVSDAAFQKEEHEALIDEAGRRILNDSVATGLYTARR